MNSPNTTAAILAAALLVAAALPAVAQNDPGPPSGGGVQPTVVPGNPDCADLGHAFGFKIDGSANGTYTFTSADGALTGGAPEDPGSSVTIANSDGSFFDWSSSLGIDAVIVKAGANANVFSYLPESVGDTLLHGPINPSNGQPFGVSHVEVCYDYEVSVEKTAATTFTRTWQWDISKGVVPAAWELFTGDAGTSKYTVAVDRTGFADSDWAVSGTISVVNDTPLDATVTGVSDAISGFGAVAVDCGGAGFPYALAAGDTLECTYATALPDGASRVNTATVTTTGVVGGGSATAAVVFGSPTTEVNAQVNVTDTNGQAWGPVADDAMWMYERTFVCDGDQGNHPNVATIVETGQSADAAVTVACYDLDVTKDATSTFTRTWDWTIDKSADQTELTLSPGQSFLVDYTVQVDAGSTDSDWAVTGGIWIANNHPARAAMLTGVTDSVGGVAAAVDCPALTVPAGGSLHCTYQADLPDGSERTNTATATLQNHAFASDGSATPAGTTDFEGTAQVLFGGPTEQIDECVDVEDTHVGFLGTVCSDDAPATFEYSFTIGPFSDPEDCGENEVDDTASLITNDTATTAEDTWTVVVTVPCPQGCTLTPGYWKTHSEHGPAPYDDTWAELPNGADTPFFLSGQSYFEVLWTAPKGNAYYILARAYIAAELNFLNGASAPPEVMDAYDAATALFETWTPAEIGDLKGNQPPRPDFLMYAGVLDMYNNGLLGPGHCSEDDTSAP